MGTTRHSFMFGRARQALMPGLAVASSPCRTAAKGYTLTEFMAAIAIMALLVGLAVPSIQSGFGKQHLRAATVEVMDVFSFARVQAQARNRAYVVTITGQGTPNVKFVVDESANARCSGVGDAGALKGARILDLSSGDFSDIRIVASSPGGLGNGSFGLCYLPDGRVVQSDTLVPVASGNAEWGAGTAWFSLQAVKEGTANTTMGLIHRVLVPYNGVPEMRPGGDGAPSV